MQTKHQSSVSISSKTKITLASFFLLLVIPLTLYAQSAESIQDKISQRSTDIKALEAEIASYASQISTLGTQANSLSNAIKTLELTQKKLEADIKVTQKKIDAKNVEISGLTDKISNTAETIVFNRKIVAKSFASMNELENQSLIETLLGSISVSDALDSVDQVAALQTSLRERIYSLEDAKTSLEFNKKSSEKAKAELMTLSKQLSDQKKVVQSTSAEKSALLKETKQSESAYQTLLANRKAQKEAFEREVSALEDALRIAIDPSSIPQVGTGVLKYPIGTKASDIRVTQYFGNTSFATKNPQIYKSGTHPGMDFAASVGTPVRASLSGTVVGSGDMDLAGGGRCRAYGRWIMLKHANGLSTLYAHLSVIGVSMGQQVSTGEIIGYSGNTGATTGPHLHFGVYATEGVRITKLVSSSYCAGVLYPLSDPSAYLNPLSYL